MSNTRQMLNGSASGSAAAAVVAGESRVSAGSSYATTSSSAASSLPPPQAVNIRPNTMKSTSHFDFIRVTFTPCPTSCRYKIPLKTPLGFIVAIFNRLSFDKT